LIEKSLVTNELYSDQLNFIKAADMPPFNSVVKHIKQSEVTTKPGFYRKLVALADYEGKTRVIAIGDYMSNVLLRPLHDKLMSCLAGLKSDYTYRQHTLSDVRINELEDPVSVDITAATDRIPAKVTAYIIGQYFDHEPLGDA
jgi:hypothetical protein